MMQKNRQIAIVFFMLAALMSSCIVQAPKYAKIEKVLTVNLGMTVEEVSGILGIPPYDIKSRTDSSFILIYKYRVADRRTIPFIVTPTNGMKWRGKYVDLFITYSTMGKVISINSCSDCEDSEKADKRLDIDLTSIITLITIVVPSVLILIFK
jgi:hypothetical protein